MAPKVLDLANRVKKDIDTQIQNLGPAVGRWNQFMTGRIGAPNAQFFKLTTDINLLSTLLMRMHVGARGGVQIMEHFKSMMDAGKQSPENLQAAIDTIIDYANDVNKPMHGPGTKAPTEMPVPKGKEMILKNGKKIIVEE
jgi:hypothetical protein